MPEPFLLMETEKIKRQDYLNPEFFMSWEPLRQIKTIGILLKGDESQFDQDCLDLWEIFGAKHHFSIVISHKKFINKVYHRFQKFFPNVPEEQILHHDDAKFNFIEVIGYTDRWVWQRNGTDIWRRGKECHWCTVGEFEKRFYFLLNISSRIVIFSFGPFIRNYSTFSFDLILMTTYSQLLNMIESYLQLFS